MLFKSRCCFEVTVGSTSFGLANLSMDLLISLPIHAFMRILLSSSMTLGGGGGGGLVNHRGRLGIQSYCWRSLK